MTHVERVRSEIVEEIKGLSLKGAFGTFCKSLRKSLCNFFVTLSGLCEECERGEVGDCNLVL